MNEDPAQITYRPVPHPPTPTWPWRWEWLPKGVKNPMLWCWACEDWVSIDGDVWECKCSRVERRGR